MSFQFSVAARNAALDSIETVIGTAAVLELRTGAPPATCATADSGTLLASLTLPADWMAAAAAGSKALLGTWTGTAVAAGTAAHFRIKASSVCHIQGTVTASGGGGDMTLDNPVLAVSQTVSISSFNVAAGGA